MSNEVASAFDAAIDQATGVTPTEVKPEPEVTQPETPPEAVATPEEESFDPSKLTGAARRAWDDTQEALRQADQERKSLRNRVPYLQRELEKYRKPAQPQAQRTEAPSVAEQRTRSPRWQKYAAEYPDEAAALDEELSARDKENAELREKVSRLEKAYEETQPRLSALDDLRAAHEQQQVQAEVASLNQAHPDWPQHVRFNTDGELTHASEPMWDWWQQAPEEVQDMLRSSSAAKSAYAYGLFKSYLREQHSAQVSHESQAKVAEAERVAQARKAALANQVPPSVSTPGVARIDPSTIPSADAFDLDIERAQKRRA